MSKSKHFYEVNPSLENYWRAIVLFGRNTASYKFALAKSLLQLKKLNHRHELITLEELAPLYAGHITEHLKQNNKQGTFHNSRFLNACREFAQNKIDKDTLIVQTIRYGFKDVLDAFHNVHGEEVPQRFFIDERREKKGIVLTDNFFTLLESEAVDDLNAETESRWRLVETAWNLKIPKQILPIIFDPETQMLQANPGSNKRIPVTATRNALNGYQKGKCFYCFKNIMIENKKFANADVDHFFPHKLKYCAEGKAIDGVANLVLACSDCNRGTGGKFDKVPSINLLERLHKRNEYLIQSDHPLKEMLKIQTGITEKRRINFLQDIYNCAKNELIINWEPKAKGNEEF